MKLATLRTAEGTRAVELTADGYVDLGATDVGELLAQSTWPPVPSEPFAEYPLDDAELAPVVPRPGKIVCVGLNYRSHILEMGRPLPEYPTLFAKFADSLIGPYDDIALAPESSAIDWEAELGVVIGRTVRRANALDAAEAIAGFTVVNDITMRDWQGRTTEWLQGKAFESTTPIGPVLVTPDELPGGVTPALALTCRVNGEVMQKADTSDLVFNPVDLVQYISTIFTLRPGDVIATGTPGGVGYARSPQKFVATGDVIVTEIDGIGRLENTGRPD